MPSSLKPRPAEVVICSGCRWPFPRPWGRNRPVCPPCRRLRAGREAADRRRLARFLRDHHWFVFGGGTPLRPHDPGREARVAEYARRAAAGLDLFAGLDDKPARKRKRSAAK